MSAASVTGLGVACSLGLEPTIFFERLVQGVCRIACVSEDSRYRSRLAARVDLDALSLPAFPLLRMYSEPSVRYALHAATQAIHEARLIERGVDLDRVGVIISTGIGGLKTIEEQYALLLERGPERVSPYFVPNAIANAASGVISMLFGFRGMNTSLSSACSSSTQAIGMALRLIQAGDLDVCVVGGTEHSSTPSGLAGFGAQRALSARHHDPQGACRPWDRDRDGFVIADGAAVLVLESAKVAQTAPQVYADLVDIGWSSDAIHPVQPDPKGTGASLSMRRAMKSLSNYQVIDYINAHATGTPMGDPLELQVLRELWPDSYDQISMSSTKSMHGHLLGAAGALEAIVTVMAMHHALMPPTINCPHPIAHDIHLLNQGAERKHIRYALSNSFGFGGTNATLLFRTV